MSTTKKTTGEKLPLQEEGRGVGIRPKFSQWGNAMNFLAMTSTGTRRLSRISSFVSSVAAQSTQ